MRKSRARIQAHAHVLHPMNTAGSTWLKESDLIFLNKEPYAVLTWHGDRKDIPDRFIPLNRKLLRHDRAGHYRYEGELEDPSSDHRPRTAS